MYVELKSGHDDDGPAWIGWVEYSKTGKTLYTHGLQLEETRAAHANRFDIDTGALYWVTTPKKDGRDRHADGRGAVDVDVDAVDAYRVHRS